MFEAPKNGKGRSIALTWAASETLRRHLIHQLEEIQTLGDDYLDQGLIFPGERGRPMRPYALTRKLERILKRSGLPQHPLP